MNRRGFLRFLGGGAAVATVAAVAPSQVWPFKKIFLPSPASLPTIRISGSLFNDGVYEVQNRLNAVYAIELESFAHQIPDLIRRESTLYNLFKMPVEEHRDFINIQGKRPPFRIPQVNGARSLELRNGSKIIFEPGIESPYRAEPDLSVSEVLSSLDRDIRRNLAT